MQMPIADLHCDLLDYLESSPQKTVFDEELLCSVPKLRAGGVFFQVLAAYTDTNDVSAQRGVREATIFQNVDVKYPKDFLRIRNKDDVAHAKDQGKIGIIFAIENASGFSMEDEPLDRCFQRLEEIIKITSPILYISMTHFPENRFCGGNTTQNVGLKEDGKELLQYLSGRKIAIDLSHTSDASAHGILDFISQRNLDFPVIASHSNFRAVEKHDRNLPDDLAKEIIRRKGLIGLNFIYDFIGHKSSDCFLRQIEHALKLGTEETLCFGADFFDTKAVSLQFNMPADHRFFHEGFDSSACYPKLIDLMKQKPDLKQNIIQNIAHQNVVRFLQSVL